MRINGEEHSTTSKDGVANLYFPMDGQLVYVSELAMKIIINNGETSGGGGEGSPCDNWAYGVNTYPYLVNWLNRYPVGSHVDVDCAYDQQCWDYASAFWRAQVNRNLETGNGYAWGCWALKRGVNSGNGKDFALISRWEDIRAGDWVVWGNNDPGHIALALEDCPAGGTNAAILFRQQDGATPRRGVFDSPLMFEGVGNDNSFQGAFRYNTRQWNP